MLRDYKLSQERAIAKECKSGRNQGKRSYGENGRRNATTNEPSSQALVAQDGLGGYDWSNDFDEPLFCFNGISSSSSSSSSDIGVLTRTGLVNPVRPNEKRAVQTINTARPVSTARSVSTARPFAPKIAQTSSVVRLIYPRMDNVRPRASSSQIKRSYNTKPVFRPKNLKQDVKTFGIKNMTTAGTRAVVNTGKGKMENDLKKSSFKLLMESQVVLRAPRKDDVYSLDLKNIVPSGGIKREFSVARTPQQNGVAERKNRTLIEAARTMLADSLLPIPFWAEAVNTACYTRGYSRRCYSRRIEKSLKCSIVRRELDSEDIAAEQALKDDLERMVAQEMVAQAVDDATRQAFEEEKRKNASTKRVAQATSITKLNTSRPSVNTASTPYVSAVSTPTDVSNAFPNDGIFSGAYDDDDVGAEANFNNMDHTIDVSPIPILKIHKNRTNHKDHQNCLLACFLSKEEPKNISQALQDEIWVEAIDERSIVVKNKARLVAQGVRQEEGIDYDEVFAPVAIIKAIRLFLAFASYMGFTVYQMDVKSAFLYGTIREEVYVQQPPGFVDPAHPNKVYKVIKALYGLHQAPRAWYETLSTFLLENGFRRGTIDKTLFIKKNKSDIMLVQVYVDDIIFGFTKQSMCTEFEDCMHKRFQMSSMGELTFFLGLQVQQQPDGIFISQDKYVADILKKFDFCSIRTATTPIESNKPLVQDEDGVDVDVHVYRSMIGSLMYLTASRPDIMFVVCACARFQVLQRALQLNAVKEFLEAFLDSDYRGVSLNRKSTTGGCQFLGRRLISWQCKKQTIVANSTTEAEYVVAANCCGQVLWIQNQMMDYGFNFMNTKIHIDNESTICIVKNPVYHSRTKHIEIRHHFIRDCYEKRLIDVVKIHTDNNVADLLTKGFDVTRFNFLVVSIGMLNL
ncbi:putative ribonuclease H-like domain-containing protein [Tanacetum coccineum]